MRTFLFLAALTASSAFAQTDVTATYLDNADFQARFAAWEDPGSFTYNTSSDFTLKSGDVFMEKFVAKGNKLGTNAGMYQELRDLPAGTYTLTCAAQHINQSNTAQACTGAYLYADDAQTEIQAAQDYSVTFTVVDGRAKVGVKLATANGNWCCIDNFRLTQDALDQAALDAALDKLIAEAEAQLTADGNEAASLQAAIDAARALKGQGTTGVTEAATALERATLSYRIANATGATPTVTTHPFLAVGTTIALGRLTVTGTAVEKGFCWSTSPEPTILDEHSTLYFTNNGNIYHLDHLQPATIYYVRAYARTSFYKVGYGKTVKMATLPMGTTRYTYDFSGDDQQNARINSASAETVWMYQNLSNIRGFLLQVHYSYGSGAGGGTADCSYGGWMRVSQNEPYQQTGTILHETNHGVGVGTTGEWYNNPNLRTETSRGDWLGPRATAMVRFFDNNTTSVIHGDNMHMWPYGINGAHEDSYNPSNKALYYANIFITHALHQDGLPCSSQVGFGTPAYTFEQDDQTKYYIKSSGNDFGFLTGYLTATATGLLKVVDASATDVKGDDSYAWYITYNPATSRYMLQNVATGKYFSYNSNTIKAQKKTTTGNTEEFMLMPARQETSYGKYTGTGYWIIKNDQSGHPALQVAKSGTTSAPNYNAASAALEQQWLFLTESDVDVFEAQAVKDNGAQLTTLLTGVRQMLQTPHVARTEEADVAVIDAALDGVLTTAEQADDKTSVSAIDQYRTSVEAALVQFLTDATPQQVDQPFDLTFLITNPDFAKNADGWSMPATQGNSCAEFTEETFDFNQTIGVKLPVATYELRMQGFQRTGTTVVADSLYQAGKNLVNATLYAKSHTKKIKGIMDDAQPTSPGTGSTKTASGVYVPSTRAGASNFFKKGFYENSVVVATTVPATFKLGFKGTTGTNYWTCFDNFRLLCYGAATTEEVTPVEALTADDLQAPVYDLQGRRVGHPQRGLYIVGGKKVIIK